MDIPPPGVVRNSGTHLDQALCQPIYGPFYLFAPNIKLPDHMQEVVSHNPHLQPGLVGLEPLAAGFVPTQSVLALLDPVFHVAPAIIDFDHFTGWESGVGNHKRDAREEFTPVPFDLGHHPAVLISAFRLVLQVHYFYLNPTLERTTYRSVQIRFQEAHQYCIAGPGENPGLIFGCNPTRPPSFNDSANLQI
jgi:hypothetical protein